MKFLKNITFISLLLGSCISSALDLKLPPPHSQPLHWKTALLFNKHAMAAIIAAPLVLFYIPYAFLTRHKATENFVKNQKDIESYSITVQLNQPHSNQLLEESFAAPDYTTVIKKALDWTKLHNFPGLKAIFKPNIKLWHDEKIYQLRPVKRSALPGYSTKSSVFWKNSKRLLTARFKLPTSTNITHGIKIKQGILSGFVWTAVSVLVGIPFIPFATLSLPFLALSYHSSAKNFVEKPEDIELYSITVKTRYQRRTVQEQHFINTAPDVIIKQAVACVQQPQPLHDRIFFEPHIKLVNSHKTYALRRITKARLPQDPITHTTYWETLEHKLADRLIIPNTVVTSSTYQEKLAFFGAAIALWILFPPLILV
jgi:hypothetical protein